MPGILSIGIYEGSDEFLDDAIAVNANMVFLHDQALRLAAGIKQRLPNIKIVGRPWLGSTEEQIAKFNRQWLHDHIVGLIGSYPAVDYWMGFNECYNASESDFETLSRQMEAEKGLADACREHGKGAVIYNGGPGTTPTKIPDDTMRQNWEPWRDIMVPMFTYPGVAYLGIHEYALDLPARFREAADWYMLRHRFLTAGLKSEGIAPPQIVVTEWAHGGDWRRFLNEQEVIDDYLWYGSEIRKDTEIAAAFHFCTGDSGGWANYDLHGSSIIPAMGQWNAAHPVPWTEPEQGGGEMPIDQAKIDQLLAQNALITDALIAFREGRLTGADGVDGYIAALRGGQVPAGYAPVGPSYPPK